MLLALLHYLAIGHRHTPCLTQMSPTMSACKQRVARIVCRPHAWPEALRPLRMRTRQRRLRSSVFNASCICRSPCRQRQRQTMHPGSAKHTARPTGHVLFLAWPRCCRSEREHALVLLLRSVFANTCSRWALSDSVRQPLRQLPVGQFRSRLGFPAAVQGATHRDSAIPTAESAAEPALVAEYMSCAGHGPPTRPILDRGAELRTVAVGSLWRCARAGRRWRRRYCLWGYRGSRRYKNRCAVGCCTSRGGGFINARNAQRHVQHLGCHFCSGARIAQQFVGARAAIRARGRNARNRMRVNE